MSVESKNKSSAKAECLMDIKDISLSFGGLKALQDVNLQIQKGEILAIIGPNGAGKSSMLLSLIHI